MAKTGILIGMTLCCVAIGVWIGLQFAPQPATNPAYSGLGGNFILRSPTGKTVSLADAQGQVALVYFGYTHCPDVCITALNKISRALDSLSPQLANQVQPFFISLDPERDTPEKLAAYGRNFDPRIQSLTGTPEQIRAVAKRYFIAHQKFPHAATYRLDHSSVMYLLNRSGKVVRLVHTVESSEDLANALLHALQS